MPRGKVHEIIYKNMRNHLTNVWEQMGFLFPLKKEHYFLNYNNLNLACFVQNIYVVRLLIKDLNLLKIL